jgi:hypothetical protein
MKFSKKIKGFRSKFEKRFSDYLKSLKIKFSYETDKLHYIIPEVKRYYIPDFTITKPLTKPKKHSTLYIETKGRFPQKDRTKMLLVKEHNPNADIRFVFQDDRIIDKRKKGRRDSEKGIKKGYRHSDWCLDHGFKYHIGETPPKEWFK